MVIEVIDHADNEFTTYYMIPKPIGEILISKFGDDIYDPYKKMGEKLYQSYMTFCTCLGDSLVTTPDITFHTV